MRAGEADAGLDARVRQVSLLWWAAAFVFSCLLNFMAEPLRDWPGDIVNYAAGSAAGAAWAQFLAWRLGRRRRSGRAEAFWKGLTLSALGGLVSGLGAGLVCWPVIVGGHLDQIVSYQIGFDLEHFTTLSVAWYFIYLVQVSADRRIRIEETVARLRVLVFKAEDAALRDQVRPERLREYFSRLSVALARRRGREAEDLVLTLSDGLRAALSSGVPRAPEERRHAFSSAVGAELGGGERAGPAPGATFSARFHIVNLVFWLGIFLLLFVTIAPVYAKSSKFTKIVVLSDWVVFCVVGAVVGVLFIHFWKKFYSARWFAEGYLIVILVYLAASFVSACVASVVAEMYWEGIAPNVSLIVVEAAYYFGFYIVWHCIYSYAQAVQRELAQRAVLARAAEAAAAARNNMLRHQVRPHFLFNALNALYALIADRRWAAARAMTQALSEYVERSFAEDARELVSIGEQVEAMQAYLTIEKIRFGDRLRVRVDIPERLAYACAPSLILHPLIENAMKYAVAATADPVDVEIAADHADDTLLLRVCDSGADSETPPAPGLGIGLRNVTARLAGHYGEHGRLQCKRLTPKGFVAEIRLPLEFACIPSAA